MNTPMPRPPKPFPWAKPVAVIALIFGVMTIFSGGSVLFGPAEAQAWAGNYVRFVVWFNFLAGFVYVVAAIGLWLGTGWAARLAGVLAIATAMVALGFGIVVLLGSAFEIRTVGALAFRFAFWAAIAWAANRAIRQT